MMPDPSDRRGNRKGQAAMAPLFVFYGVEAEYVLAPLCREMLRRGHECVEIFVKNGVDAEQSMRALPKGRPVALVTSAHFLQDGPTMAEHLGIGGCLSLLEAVALLAPVATICVPHDLSSPLLPEEIPYLRLVDLWLGALDGELALRRYLEVEIVGWIKYHEAAVEIARRGRAIWLFSDVESRLHNSGLGKTFKRILPFTRPWCSIKFAPNEIARPLERELRDAGVDVIDSTESAVAQALLFDAVVSNGDSSTVREAGLMGKPIYIITDPKVAPRSNMRRMWQYLDLDCIRFVPNLDAIPEQVPSFPSRIRTFDVDAAVAAILRKVTERA